MRYLYYIRLDSTYIRCCILAIMDTVAVLLDEPSGMMG